MRTRRCEIYQLLNDLFWDQFRPSECLHRGTNGSEQVWSRTSVCLWSWMKEDFTHSFLIPDWMKEGFWDSVFWDIFFWDPNLYGFFWDIFFWDRLLKMDKVRGAAAISTWKTIKYSRQRRSVPENRQSVAVDPSAPESRCESTMMVKSPMKRNNVALHWLLL